MILLYQAICGLFAVLVGGVVVRSRRWEERITGGLLLVVLLLRLFLVK
jgi:hypothetical protein